MKGPLNVGSCKTWGAEKQFLHMQSDMHQAPHEQNNDVALCPCAGPETSKRRASAQNGPVAKAVAQAVAKGVTLTS